MRNNKASSKKSTYRRQYGDDNSLSTTSYDTDEEALSLEASPLMRIQRHKAYLKYGSGPNLYKSGSMRAGPSLSTKNNPGLAAETRKNEKKTTNKFLNKNQVDRLYRSTSSKTGAKKPATKSASSNLVMTPEGKPLKAGNMRGKG